MGDRRAWESENRKDLITEKGKTCYLKLHRKVEASYRESWPNRKRSSLLIKLTFYHVPLTLIWETVIHSRCPPIKWHLYVEHYELKIKIQTKNFDLSITGPYNLTRGSSSHGPKNTQNLKDSKWKHTTKGQNPWRLSRNWWEQIRPIRNSFPGTLEVLGRFEKITWQDGQEKGRYSSGNEVKTLKHIHFISLFYYTSLDYNPTPSSYEVQQE